MNEIKPGDRYILPDDPAAEIFVILGVGEGNVMYRPERDDFVRLTMPKHEFCERFEPQV